MLDEGHQKKKDTRYLILAYHSNPSDVFLEKINDKYEVLKSFVEVVENKYGELNHEYLGDKFHEDLSNEENSLPSNESFEHDISNPNEEKCNEIFEDIIIARHIEYIDVDRCGEHSSIVDVLSLVP
jgi:hypothetical protein